MRKKSIVLIVIITSICWSSSSSAAVQPGSKCSKQNATTAISGKKYTCIKSGGKLVWNEGVRVKKGEILRAGICPQVSALDKGSGISVARANSLIGMKERKLKVAPHNWNGFTESSREMGKISPPPLITGWTV